MLILTRKRDESIRIGQDVIVRVMRTSPRSVKLGIEAPDSVRITRGEFVDSGEPLKGAPHAVSKQVPHPEDLVLQH